jgi:hypothetical protein
VTTVWAIVVVGVALTPGIVGIGVTLATEPHSRHRRPTATPDPGGRAAGPATGPTLLGDQHGAASTVEMPTARPYTTAPTGIPPLVVDSPTGARGHLPAGMPVTRLRFCSLCLDGQLASPTLLGVCAWCGTPRAVTT